MKISEELKKQKAVPKQLTLPQHKEFPSEITELETKYFDKYGINNTTARYIKETKKNIKEHEISQQQEFANNEVLKNITNAFGPYTVVSYKSMDEISKQYNLYISGLNRYEHPIPVENLEELDMFTEYLKKMDGDVLSRLRFKRNNQFVFTTEGTGPIQHMSFESLFYIMAPKSHLSSKTDDICIGREIQQSHQPKPKFKYEFKVNRPEPKDPIIFLPFYILNKIYCVVISSWDDVADDLRIRKLI